MTNLNWDPTTTYEKGDRVFHVVRVRRSQFLIEKWGIPYQWAVRFRRFYRFFRLKDPIVAERTDVYLTAGHGTL